jgi:hypothetical protein
LRDVSVFTDDGRRTHVAGVVSAKHGRRRFASIPDRYERADFSLILKKVNRPDLI